MMRRTREAVFLGLGILAGLALSGPAAQAAEAVLTARPTSQTFYVHGQQVQFEAYEIHGNNFVKLRDIGRIVDFGVTYDGATNTVHIDPNAPYVEEVTPPAQTTPSPSALTEENVRAAILALKETYPHGATYPTPYRPNTGLERPFSNCDHCAGWPCCVPTPRLAACHGTAPIIPSGKIFGRVMCWTTATDHPDMPS